MRIWIIILAAVGTLHVDVALGADKIGDYQTFKSRFCWQYLEEKNLQPSAQIDSEAYSVKISMPLNQEALEFYVSAFVTGFNAAVPGYYNTFPENNEKFLTTLVELECKINKSFFIHQAIINVLNDRRSNWKSNGPYADLKPN